MTRKELRERLYDHWWHAEGDLVSVDIWQARPNTAVRVKIGDFTGFGFTKVRYPDEWDTQYGIQMAVMKAIAGIVRIMPDDVCADIEVALCQPIV